MLRLASRGGLEQVEQRCSFEQPKLVVLCKGKVGLKKKTNKRENEDVPLRKISLLQSHLFRQPFGTAAGSAGLVILDGLGTE